LAGLAFICGSLYLVRVNSFKRLEEAEHNFFAQKNVIKDLTAGALKG
jgi:hypothetical protein